ncbi:hypothetical protein IWQ61_000778 [Dispira simplex]|nr:hypothetical protein IWQ61_000778 [Dispira simplex]
MKRSMVYTSLVGVVALSFAHGQDADVVNPTTAETSTEGNAQGAVEEQQNAAPDELRNYSLKDPIKRCNGDPGCISQFTRLEPMQVRTITQLCRQENGGRTDTGDFAECFINQSAMGGMPGYNGQYQQGNYGAGGNNWQSQSGQNYQFPNTNTNTGTYSSNNPGYSNVYNSKVPTGGSYTGGRYTGDANTRPSLSVAMVAAVGAFTLGGTLLQL